MRRKNRSSESCSNPAFESRSWSGLSSRFFQQWCGINVIFNYGRRVFSAAGFKVSDILFNIVVTGAVNLVFTSSAMGLVDKGWPPRPEC